MLKNDYKKPNMLACLFNSRTTIIVVSLCTAASTIMPENTYKQVLFNNRSETEETDPTASALAPKTSPRPQPRPAE